MKFYVGPTRLRLLVSPDGASFSTPTQVSDAEVAQGGDVAWCPSMQLDADGRVFLIWPQGSAFGKERIMFSTSSDNGTSFSSPVSITDPNEDVRCGALAVAPDGTVMVAWGTGDPDSNNYKAYLIDSRDHGATFSPPARIEDMDGHSGCPPIIFRSNNDLGVFWGNPILPLTTSGPKILPDILFTDIPVPQ